MPPIPSPIVLSRWLPTPSLRLRLRLRLSGRGYRIHATSKLAIHRAKAVHRADDGQDGGVKLFHSREELSHHTQMRLDVPEAPCIRPPSQRQHPREVQAANRKQSIITPWPSAYVSVEMQLRLALQTESKRLQGTSLGVRLHQSC